MSGLDSFVFSLITAIGSLAVFVIFIFISYSVSYLDRETYFKLAIIFLVVSIGFGGLALGIEKHWVNTHFLDKWYFELWILIVGVLALVSSFLFRYFKS
ncbi:MAG: hypothetical protein AB8E15_07615 [Bdellovibrionales bacterium]